MQEFAIETKTQLRLKAGVLVCGAVLAGTQVLVIRRALALAGGDEVVFALTLAAWLLCVAAGGSLGASLVRRLHDLIPVFTGGLILLSVSSPTALVILPIVADFSGWIPGTMPGGGGMIAALMATLLPVGVAGGALFPIGCRLLKTSGVDAVSQTYLLESGGSFLAGTAVTLIFAPHLSGLTMAVFLSSVGFSAAFNLIIHRIPIWVFPVAALIPAYLLQPSVRKLEARLISLMRPGMQVRDVLETPYGLIEVTDRQGQISVYENGVLLAISDEPAGAEERAHLSLTQHPRPERVLWIGGSLGGALTDALQHPSLKRLDLVELNPILFDLGRKFAGLKTSDALADPRVTLHRQDGRRFLASAATGSYDLIALNLPGPRTVRLAKFYTVEGFRLVRRALKPGGVLVFAIPSAEDYIGEDLSSLLGSLYATLHRVFSEVRVLPGENALFVADDSKSDMALFADSISARLNQRGIYPLYWDKYRLRDRLSDSRGSALQEAIDRAPVIGLNRDAAPISFYLQQVLWSRQVRGGLPSVLKALRGIFPQICILTVLITLLAALGIRLIMPKAGNKIALGWAVLTVGLAGVSLEVLSLTAYQVYFGSGYREVGLLVGLYMAGLAAGAAVSRNIITVAARRQFFLVIQAGWIVLPIGLIVLTLIGPAFLQGWPLVGQMIFFLYLLMIGFVGGLHFPLAVSYAGSGSAVRAGVFYSLDLLGAASGALVIGLLALPLIGLNSSALLLALMNLPPLILLVKVCNC